MANYVLLERIELNASAASVTFDNIPQSGYTDLVIKGSVRSTVNAVQEDLNLYVNGSGSNFSRRRLGGTGTAAFSDFYNANTPGTAPGATATASTFSNFELIIPNYTSSNPKSMSYDTVNENNATASLVQTVATLWNSTAAVSSLTFYVQSANLVAGSAFSLYGLAAVDATPAISPYASGGNSVTQDGTYWYHAFTSSGTFTPSKSLTADILLVAGGGGGGSGYYTGGGGAGGLVSLTDQTVTTASTVIVGAGGASATIGVNSQFASLTAAIGGGFGGPQLVTGGNGGSGGGGAGTSTNGASLAGGTGTSGQGTNGGNGFNRYESIGAGGGGGGKNAAGGNASAATGGVGGSGSSSFSSYGAVTGTGQNISGTYWYAGGGGGGAATTGGTGGNGGGAAGRSGFSGVAGIAGLATTGGGGGGANLGDPVYPGGAGGSGVVIIRYAM